jgi:hypothetical protein
MEGFEESMSMGFSPYYGGMDPDCHEEEVRPHHLDRVHAINTTPNLEVSLWLLKGSGKPMGMEPWSIVTNSTLNPI